MVHKNGTENRVSEEVTPLVRHQSMGEVNMKSGVRTRTHRSVRGRGRFGPSYSATANRDLAMAEGGGAGEKLRNLIFKSNLSN